MIMGRVLMGLLILAVIGSAMSCVTLVRSDERAVVRRFGRVLPEKPGPGLLVGLPWGMDQVSRVSVKDRTITVGWTNRETDEDSVSMPPGQLLTGDHNLLNLQAVIEYRVHEEQVERYVLLEERIEPLITRAADAAMAEWLAGHKVDDAILEGKRKLQFILKARIAEWIAPYELGVHIERASIMLIDPPSEVRDSFNEVGQAHSRKETQKNRALEEEATIGRKAKQEVFRIESETAAYVREQQLSARADADSFMIRLKEYRSLSKQNPQHLNNMWVDEVTRIYEQLNASGRIDVLDHHLGSDGINIMQFPLQKKR
jgi:modulator of FtsH protease HflK